MTRDVNVEYLLLFQIVICYFAFDLYTKMATESQSHLSITSKRIKFCFTWTVENFSEYCTEHITHYPALNSEKHFSHPEHPDYKFSLSVRPKGQTEEFSEFVSLFLQPESTHANPLRILFTFSVIDSSGQKRNSQGKYNLNFW